VFFLNPKKNKKKHERRRRLCGAAQRPAGRDDDGGSAEPHSALRGATTTAALRSRTRIARPVARPPPRRCAPAGAHLRRRRGAIGRATRPNSRAPQGSRSRPAGRASKRINEMSFASSGRSDFFFFFFDLKLFSF